jgi:DNA invertase Pin-like site-specific DNA recombinase
MKHTALYVRVSSAAQNIASQLPDLKRWADACGANCVWYSDRFSGRSMNRPAWSKLAAAIEAGEVERVVVWRIDRLGRTVSGLSTLFEDLCRRKVGLVSLKDGIDLQSAAGRLLAHVLASMAAFENELRSERVRAGQAAARAAGKTWGGSEKGRRIWVSDEQIAVIHRMKR